MATKIVEIIDFFCQPRKKHAFLCEGGGGKTTPGCLFLWDSYPIDMAIFQFKNGQKTQ